MMAGPAAMNLAVQELAQRTTMVRCACLGRDQQVTCADACADQLLARQAHDAVGARVPVAPGERVGEIRGVVGAESGRHEAGALDADVAAARQAGYHERDHRVVWPDGEDGPAGITGGDAAERRGRHRDAALYGRAWLVITRTRRVLGVAQPSAA
jgi:hypothetical protein